MEDKNQYLIMKKVWPRYSYLPARQEPICVCADKHDAREALRSYRDNAVIPRAYSIKKIKVYTAVN